MNYRLWNWNIYIYIYFTSPIIINASFSRISISFHGCQNPLNETLYWSFTYASAALKAILKWNPSSFAPEGIGNIRSLSITSRKQEEILRLHYYYTSGLFMTPFMALLLGPVCFFFLFSFLAWTLVIDLQNLRLKIFQLPRQCGVLLSFGFLWTATAYEATSN